MNNNILIVVSHPDDELLGMGGTIQKLVKQGKKVSILLLAKTGNARLSDDPNVRWNHFNTVAQDLGITKVFHDEFPDTGFDTIPLLNIIRKIEQVVSKVKPEVVYTHFFNDLNVDHCITSKAVITALRPIEKYRFVKKIYLFEVLSSTEWKFGGEDFSPNHFENIGDFIDKKKNLLSVYSSEINDFPHPRSYEGIETLAKYRGMQCGIKHAEAFMLYRSVDQ